MRAALSNDIANLHTIIDPVRLAKAGDLSVLSHVLLARYHSTHPRHSLQYTADQSTYLTGLMAFPGHLCMPFALSVVPLPCLLKVRP